MSRPPSTTYPMIVGQVLARLRKQAGLTQAGLAQKMGLSQATWSKIERGASPLSVETLFEAAKKLHTQPTFIIEQADAAERRLREQGIHIVSTSWLEKVKAEDPFKAGIAFLGGAAVGALVAALIAKANEKEEE